MGLFSTVLHIYRKNQPEIVAELSNELGQNHGFRRFARLGINDSNYETVFEDEIYFRQGLFYLVTQPHGDWTTIIELNVNTEHPVYLYELTTSLSKRLGTYALSFHLHDSDVLCYNLDKAGEPLDGYNSDYQYFLSEPAGREEVFSQRHSPHQFSGILPPTKTTDHLNAILNEGYWEAFDQGHLGEDGDEKYFIDEEERFLRVGKYLEIFSKDVYPFANWRENLLKFNLPDCHLLRSER
jgi:hypothetical protein